MALSAMTTIPQHHFGPIETPFVQSALWHRADSGPFFVLYREIKDTALKNALKRWHLEYKLICGYNHVGMEKLVGQALTNRRHGLTESQRKDYFEKKLLHSLIISWIATASACTEIYRFVSYNLEITGELTKLWNVLEHGSLLGKVFWNLRAKTILPTLF